VTVCRPIESTAKTSEHTRPMDSVTNDARAILDRWQAAEERVTASGS
jgi:hypothetical protein